MDPEAPLPSISQMLANPTHRTERYLGDISYDDGNPRQLKGYGTLLFMRSGTAYLLGKIPKKQINIAAKLMDKQ